MPISYYIPTSSKGYPAFERIKNTLKATKVITEETVIYGVRKAFVSKFAASPNWQDLYDYCSVKLQNYDRKALQAVVDHEDVDNIFSDIREIIKKSDTVNPSSQLIKLIEAGHYCWTESSRNRQLESLYDCFKLKNPIIEDPRILEDFLYKLEDIPEKLKAKLKDSLIMPLPSNEYFNFYAFTNFYEIDVDWKWGDNLLEKGIFARVMVSEINYNIKVIY